MNRNDTMIDCTSYDGFCPVRRDVDMSIVVVLFLYRYFRIDADTESIPYVTLIIYY